MKSVVTSKNNGYNSKSGNIIFSSDGQYQGMSNTSGTILSHPIASKNASNMVSSDNHERYSINSSNLINEESYNNTNEPVSHGTVSTYPLHKSNFTKTDSPYSFDDASKM